MPGEVTDTRWLCRATFIFTRHENSPFGSEFEVAKFNFLQKLAEDA